MAPLFHFCHKQLFICTLCTLACRVYVYMYMYFTTLKYANILSMVDVIVRKTAYDLTYIAEYEFLRALFWLT